MSFDWSQYLNLAKELAGQVGGPEFPSPLFGQSVAENLRQLRMYRKQADYVDSFPGLSGITLIAIRRSDQVISDLSSL